MGFEPTRAEPTGLAGRRLNHSAKVSIVFITVEILVKGKLNSNRLINLTPVGLEPTISGSVDRCLIHWATGPSDYYQTTSQLVDITYFMEMTNAI